MNIPSKVVITLSDENECCVVKILYRFGLVALNWVYPKWGWWLSNEVVEIVYIFLLFLLELKNNAFLVSLFMNIVLHKVWIAWPLYDWYELIDIILKNGEFFKDHKNKFFIKSLFSHVDLNFSLLIVKLTSWGKTRNFVIVTCEVECLSLKWKVVSL